MAEPKKYNEIMNDLNNLLYSIDYNKEMTNPLAFTYRNILDREGSCYKIVCNDESEELTPYLLSHEAGHILFGHCKVDKLEKILVKNKIDGAWSKVSKYFKGYDLDKVVKYFENYLYNVTMDWEVNSKYFDYDEFLEFEKLTSEYLQTKVECLYPSRMKYPVKKTWIEYITLITMNPDKFFKEMSNDQNGENGEDGEDSDQDGDQNDNQNGDGQGNNQDSKNKNKSKKKGNGKGESKDDEDSDGNGQPKKLSDLPKEVRDEIIKKVVSKMKSKYEEKEAKDEIEKETRELEEGDGDEGVSFGGDSDGIGSSHSSLEMDDDRLYTENYSDSTLEEQLLKCLNTKRTFQTKRDIVYNYNRNKYNSSVMYVKFRKEKKITKNNMVVLLDVSGSIEFSNVQKFVEAFKNVSDKLRRKCSLILWDTDLVAEYNNVSDEIKSFYGGGTDMASGLKYIESKKEYDNATVIIVSDFEDNVEEWKIDRRIYGICWSKEGLDDAVNRLDSNNKKEFNRMFKKILVQEE